MPAGARGNPQLVGFWDGGKPASATCLYVRYRTSNNDFEARLLASKARVTPSSDATSKLKVSMPRNELRGLLYLARLITVILPGMVDKPTSIFIAGDSECTISAMECQNKILGVWFGNRVAEVQDHMAYWKRQGIKVNHFITGQVLIILLTSRLRARLM